MLTGTQRTVPTRSVKKGERHQHVVSRTKNEKGLGRTVQSHFIQGTETHECFRHSEKGGAMELRWEASPPIDITHSSQCHRVLGT